MLQNAMMVNKFLCICFRFIRQYITTRALP